MYQVYKVNWPKRQFFCKGLYSAGGLYNKLQLISESTTEDGDGWDDDDGDWGSLEDSNSKPLEVQNKNNEITKEELDSWATDLMSNKVPDKSAVVKQGIQSLNLVS